MPFESSIVRPLMEKLRAIPGGYALKIHGSEYQKAGVPDILFWKGSVPFAFEVKRPGGRGATPIQEVQLRRMAAAGVITAVVRSVDEVRAILSSFGIEMK